MDTAELILRSITPVVINSFNQPSYLRNIVERFRQNEFRNIFILDNGSSYPPLIDLYRSYAGSEVRVLYYNDNKGPRFFHLSGIYRHYLGTAPHLYTDPDLEIGTLAGDFMMRLTTLADRYRLGKVGCALEIPPPGRIVETPFFLREQNAWRTIEDWEAGYWEHAMEEGVYRAPIDTTLHLFVPSHFSGDFLAAARVAGPGYTVQHLPWYRDHCQPEDEAAFYRSLQRWSNYAQ